jgi:hypothetical protein
LEVFLANYINTSNSANTNSNPQNGNMLEKFYYSKNIASPSVFTSQEFLTLSEVAIIQGATENDLRNSVSNTSSNMSSHYSDNENDEDNPPYTAATASQLKLTIEIKEESVEKNSAVLQMTQQNQTVKALIVDNDKLPQYKRPLHESSSSSSSSSMINQNCEKDTDNEKTTVNTKVKKTKVSNDKANNSSVGGGGGLKNAKANVKVNELLEQRPLLDQANIATSTTMADYEFRIEDVASDVKISPSKMINGKNVNGVASVATTASLAKKKICEQNQEFLLGSPAKLTTKRRRSSQKSYETICNSSRLEIGASSDNLSNQKIVENNFTKNSSRKSSTPSSNRRKQLKKTDAKANTEKPSETNNGSPASPTNNKVHTNNLHVIEDHSSCSTSSQQDEEIKELLMQKSTILNQQQQQTVNQLETNIRNPTPTSNMIADLESSSSSKTTTNKQNLSNNKVSNSPINDPSSKNIPTNQHIHHHRNSSLNNISPSNLLIQNNSFNNNLNSTKCFAEELKELIQKEKQTTADLFLQLLKVQEESSNNVNASNSATTITTTTTATTTATQPFLHQNSNSNSNDNIFNELNSNSANILLNGTHFLQQQQQQLNSNSNKSTTPVFVDQLLMSPLFTTFLPSSACSSASSASNSSTGSNNSSSLTSNTTTLLNGNNNNNNNNNNTQFNSMQSTFFSKFATSGMSTGINKTPSSSPITVIQNNSELSSGGSGFKNSKNNKSNISKNSKSNSKHNISNSISTNNTTNKSNTINSSLISSLKFDNNSNGSFEDLLSTTNHQNLSECLNNKISSSFNSINNNNEQTLGSISTVNHATSSQRNAAKTINGENKPVNNVDNDEQKHHTSTPPPLTSQISAPSPTQFFPYASAYHQSASHIMHRPIPILQKADAAITSLINNLSSNINSVRSSPTSQINKNNNSDLAKNNNYNNENSTNTGNNKIKTTNVLANKAACDLNELIKLQQQQQQIFSTLRSNSIISNSPLMFNHLNGNGNNTNAINNNSNTSTNNSNCNGNSHFLSNYSSNSNSNSGTNMFSNYPNISPANTLNSAGLMSGNGNGSPTSNLFPSITSLFQSPIGTPRVTPTPQHFAAYLFNEEQFHSLIFPPSSSSSLSNTNHNSQMGNDAFLDACNLLSSHQSNHNGLNGGNNNVNTNSMISNFVNNSELSNNLSPLPLFSNLITTSNNQQLIVQQSNAKTNNSVNESDGNSNSLSSNSSESKSNNILLSINN